MVAIGPSRRSAVSHKFGRDWRLADIGREGREPIWGACSIGVIETFRCELTGCNISCSRCLKKDPGILPNAWVRVSRCLNYLGFWTARQGCRGMGVAALPA